MKKTLKIIVQAEQDQENKSNFQNPTTSLEKWKNISSGRERSISHSNVKIKQAHGKTWGCYKRCQWERPDPGVMGQKWSSSSL